MLISHNPTQQSNSRIRREQGDESTKDAYLCVSGVGVKYVGKEFAGDSNAGNYETVDIVGIDDEGSARRLCGNSGHPVEIDEEGEEHLICGWTIFEDAEEVGFEGDRWDVAGVEGQGG